VNRQSSEVGGKRRRAGPPTQKKQPQKGSDALPKTLGIGGGGGGITTSTRGDPPEGACFRCTDREVSAGDWEKARSRGGKCLPRGGKALGAHHNCSRCHPHQNTIPQTKGGGRENQNRGKKKKKVQKSDVSKPTKRLTLMTQTGKKLPPLLLRQILQTGRDNYRGVHELKRRT